VTSDARRTSLGHESGMIGASSNARTRLERRNSQQHTAKIDMKTILNARVGDINLEEDDN
jgi:hypothetical protein